MPTVSSVTGACSDTMSASASSSSRLWRASSLYGSQAMTLTPEPFEAPLQCPGDGAEPDEACGLSGHLPRPEPLVGDRAVAKRLARPHIRVGRQQVAGGPEEQRDRHLGDGVGIAAGRVQHRDARAGGAGDIDVVRVAAGRCNGPKRQVEHRAADRITLDDKHIRVLCGRALGELLGGVDPQWRLIDPRVVDHVGELAQLVETRTTQWSRHESAKSGHDCSCWRTVTRVSRAPRYEGPGDSDAAMPRSGCFLLHGLVPHE